MGVVAWKIDGVVSVGGGVVGCRRTKWYRLDAIVGGIVVPSGIVNCAIAAADRLDQQHRLSDRVSVIESTLHRSACNAERFRRPTPQLMMRGGYLALRLQASLGLRDLRSIDWVRTKQ